MVVRSEASWKASRSPLATMTLPAAGLFARNGGGEEIVRLEARLFGVGEAAGGDELGKHVELVDDVALENAAALIGREELLAPVGRGQRVPARRGRPEVSRSARIGSGSWRSRR